jgi:uncharacterized protein YdhG (YjbR/CyaY superfamily)
VIGKIKDEMLQNFKNNVQSIKDFFFDEEGNLFGINFSALADMMPTLQEIVDTIVSALPKWMRPDTLTEKLADAEADLIKAQDKLDSNPDYAPYIKKVEKAQAKVDSIKTEIETKFPNSVSEIETNNNIMKEKTNELKEVVSEKNNVTGAVNFVDTSVKKGGDNISYNTHTSYPIRIKHDDSSAQALSEVPG